MKNSFDVPVPESLIQDDSKNDINLRLNNNDKAKMLKTIIMGIDNSVDFEESVSSFDTNSRNLKLK